MCCRLDRGTRATTRIALVGAALAMVCASSGGCQLGYFLVDPEKEQKVKAEYDRLGTRKLAVVVWADQSTLDIYPRARRRVARAVSYYMKKHLPKARLVDAEAVVRLQEERGASWEGLSAGKLCRELECELILRLDLLEYTTRASSTRELRKGRIRATLNLYEGGDDTYDEAVYETEVTTVYPPASLHGVPDQDESQILHETVEAFAEAVSRKFYDHGKSMRGPAGR